MKKALFIVNPCSGKKKLFNNIGDIDTALFEGGYSADIYFTKCRKDATSKVIADGGRYDMIVCGGGDGTYNEVISGVLEAGLSVPVGYIPAGTTNDFANTLGIPAKHLSAAKKITDGNPSPIDVGRFGDIYFSYIASFGAFTASSYSASQKMKNRFGHTAYIFEGAKEIKDIKPIKIKVEANGEVIEDEFIFGAVCNSRSIAGLIKLEERVVDLSDGLFEIVLVRKPRHLINYKNIMSSVKNGDNTNENVVFLHADKVKITTEGELDWSLDGEYATSCGEIEIINMKHAISLVL